MYKIVYFITIIIINLEPETQGPDEDRGIERDIAPLKYGIISVFFKYNVASFFQLKKFVCFNLIILGSRFEEGINRVFFFNFGVKYAI